MRTDPTPPNARTPTRRQAGTHGGPASTPPTSTSASADALPLGPHGLDVPLSHGSTYFNYYWLRDACPEAIDPETRERVFDVSSLPDGPRPITARMDGDALLIVWHDAAHRTRLPLSLLEAASTDRGRALDPAALPRRPWFADAHATFARLSQGDIERSDSERARFARALIEDGIALVSGMEDSDASLIRLSGTLGALTPTVDGSEFDVRLTINPTNLAYTARALELHTDLPNEEAAPGVQFLHCRANSVAGGRSLFVDGTAVAEALRVERPADFALLASHDIPFFRRHDGWDYRAHQRVIELDPSGAVSGVTVSQHLQDSLDLPQTLLDDYYPALCRFLRMLREDRFVVRFRLSAGECIVFDNHRVVHGREAFVAESGQRHLRGCYVDRGALRSTYRTLVRRATERTDPAVRAGATGNDTG